MDIYLLEESTYERLEVIDDFTSFIWTERMSSPGDFELALPPSPRWNSMRMNRLLTHTKTKELMIIEERHETTNDQGETVLTIRGRSMDSIFERRAVIPPTGKANWKNYGPIWEAVVNLVRDFALRSTSMGGSRDLLPDLYIWEDVNEEEVFDIAVPIQDLYTAIKDLCDSRNYRFGIDLVSSSPRLRFYVATPDKRNIYFSTKLDTLEDPSFLHSIAGHYNVAYIWSRDGKYRTSVGLPSLNKAGFDRRVLAVDASDLDVDEENTQSQVISQMKQRGLEELAKHKEMRLFDGKVTNADAYIYRTHYEIGDIVTLIDDNNNHQEVRVSEYIFAMDQEGLRSYPTFTTVLEE